VAGGREQCRADAETVWNGVQRTTACRHPCSPPIIPRTWRRAWGHSHSRRAWSHPHCARSRNASFTPRTGHAGAVSGWATRSQRVHGNGRLLHSLQKPATPGRPPGPSSPQARALSASPPTCLICPVWRHRHRASLSGGPLRAVPEGQSASSCGLQAPPSQLRLSPSRPPIPGTRPATT
jgi:hypothetical protein